MIVLTGRVRAEEKLRIAVLADFEGPHARSWLRWFVARGHEVHAVSFYAPSRALEGVTLHTLSSRGHGEAGATKADAAEVGGPLALAPRGLLRVAHGLRYRAWGLARVVREIAPDVFHGHYLVEHGYYGALAGVHPYVVTAWGSDVLVEPERDRVSREIARWTLRHADLATSNNAYMAERMAALAGPSLRVEVVTLGAERYDLEHAAMSVNRRPRDRTQPQTVISTRAHEALYNIDSVLEAYGLLARERGEVRLVVAHGGPLTARLQAQARTLAGRVEFAGFLDRGAFRDALSAAEVFVSVPSSDATSVALLQAMAAGAFPIVSDLPSQRELIDDGVNGFRVPVRRADVLAERMRQALEDDDLRMRAAEINRRIVEERGLNETQMAKMERLYLELREQRAAARG